MQFRPRATIILYNNNSSENSSKYTRDAGGGPYRAIKKKKPFRMSTAANGVVVIERPVMCSGCVGFARSFEFSFSLGSRRRDGGTLRLIYDNGSGAASPAAADNFFFFAYAPRERKFRVRSGNRQCVERCYVI